MHRLPAFGAGIGFALVLPTDSAPPGGPSDDLALSAWALRLPGVEVAPLVWDGDLDPGPAPAWASPAAPRAGVRSLCFATDEVRLALEVARRPPRTVRGRLVVPLGPTGLPDATDVARLALELQGAAGERSDVRVEGPGELSAVWPVRGPMRLVAHRGGRPVLATSWVLID